MTNTSGSVTASRSRANPELQSLRSRPPRSFLSTRHNNQTNSLENKMEKANRYLPLLGRVLIGAPFILSGLGKLATHDATVGYISSVGLEFPQLGGVVRAPLHTRGGGGQPAPRRGRRGNTGAGGA